MRDFYFEKHLPSKERNLGFGLMWIICEENRMPTEVGKWESGKVGKWERCDTCESNAFQCFLNV